MKTKMKLVVFVLLGLCLVLNSCSEADSASSQISAPKTLSTLVLDANEIMDFDNELEDLIGISNLNKDLSRKSFVNIDTDELFIPIIGNFEISDSSVASKDSNFPKLETGGGIKFKVARRYPRANINHCQGDCKCGVGFRCGNEKYIYVKPKSVQTFSQEDRLASGQILIDIESNYLIVSFDTEGINWLTLDSK
jgi:hypothetical protein